MSLFRLVPFSFDGTELQLTSEIPDMCVSYENCSLKFIMCKWIFCFVAVNKTSVSITGYSWHKHGVVVTNYSQHAWLYLHFTHQLSLFWKTVPAVYRPDFFKGDLGCAWNSEMYEQVTLLNW